MAPSLHSLQLGMSWFPEQDGNGLDRMYHGLISHLPEVGVGVCGTVAGSTKVATGSAGHVEAFAQPDSLLPSRLIKVRRKVSQILSENSVDLIAAHFALYTAPVATLLKDRPLVVHFHGPWGMESRVEGESQFTSWVKEQVERFVYHHGSAFIVLSTAFRDVLVNTFDVDPARIYVVPGGVDVSTYHTGLSRVEAREALGWPTGRPVVVAVRRLARRMGLENLIDAIADLRTSIPDIRLYVAGKGPLRAELQARIDAYGLKDAARLLGFVREKDLPLVYRAANVSIVPTVALEGFGLITVEALASGTPVLVTPHGGLPEVVAGLSENLVLPGDTPQVLTDALRQALIGTLPLPSFLECQAYAQEKFDWSVVAQKTKKVYENILKQE